STHRSRPRQRANQKHRSNIPGSYRQYSPAAAAFHHLYARLGVRTPWTSPPPASYQNQAGIKRESAVHAIRIRQLLGHSSRRNQFMAAFPPRMLVTALSGILLAGGACSPFCNPVTAASADLQAPASKHAKAKATAPAPANPKDPSGIKA